MVVTLSGIVMLVRLLQRAKAQLPMVVTLSGIVMLVRLLQPAKAETPMLVTQSGIVMLVRLMQEEKAITPILVTPSGIVMPVRLVHNEKAALPMLVTGLPSMTADMVSVPDAFLSQPVMVTVSSLISYFKLGSTDASSVGLTSSLGAVGFSLADSEPSDDDFSPQPAASSEANSRRAFFIPDTYHPPGAGDKHGNPTGYNVAWSGWEY